MPAGLYRLTGPAAGGGTLLERFRCRLDPDGWRYAADLLDPVTGAPVGGVEVVCDSRWRQRRVELRSAGWRLRGGVAGREVVWARLPTTGAGPAPDRAGQGAAVAAGLATGPALTVALARLLLPDGADTARVSLVRVEGPALAARTVREQWARVGSHRYDEAGAALRVEHLRAVDADTGERRDVHLAGDVVLAAPGVELLELDGPPSAAAPG